MDSSNLDALRNAFAVRATFYAHMYDVLTAEYGAKRALELLSNAATRLGNTLGQRLRIYAPANLCGLRDGFFAGIPNIDEIFKPEVTRCDGYTLAIQIHTCPMKSTWQAMGRTTTDIENLCSVAGCTDRATFATAGFHFTGTTWKEGQSGCCMLRVELPNLATVPPQAVP